MGLVSAQLHTVYLEDFHSLASRTNLNHFRNTRWLITGATGFVPAYLVRFLCWLNDEYSLGIQLHLWVRSVERAETLFPWAAKAADWMQLSAPDWNRPADWGMPDCDYLVHAASPATPAACAADPNGVARCNVEATAALLQGVIGSGLKGFLFFSSSEVYGEMGTDSRPGETESGLLDPASPRSIYPLSKRLGEALCHEAARSSGVPVRIARIFHTYGPGMDLQGDGRVFADFIGNAVRREYIILKSDGSARRAFCYLADTVAGLLQMLSHDGGALCCNVGNPNAILSVNELADLISRLGPGNQLKKIVMDKKAKQSVSSSVFPNVERLQALGWAPLVSAEDGFARTLTSYM